MAHDPAMSARLRPSRALRALCDLFGLALLCAAGAWLPSCSIATPLRWTAPPESAPEELYISVTHAVLDPAQRDAFDEGTEALFATLAAEEGLLAYSRRKELFGNEAWTMTVWRDAAAHAAFVRSASHRRAMREGRAALVRARFAEFLWPKASGRPNWKAALAALAPLPLVDYSGPAEAR